MGSAWKPTCSHQIPPAVCALCDEQFLKMDAERTTALQFFPTILLLALCDEQVRRMDAERIKACAAPAAAAACNSSQQGMHAQQGHEQGFSAKNVLAVAQELNVENSLVGMCRSLRDEWHRVNIGRIEQE
eukprot:1152052-Pelagomonas_calceolata.AAC.1